MMLADKNDTLDAASLGGCDPLTRVKFRRIEDRRRRVAVAPFLVRISIQPVVDDCDDFEVEEVLRWRRRRHGCRGGSEERRGKDYNEDFHGVYDYRFLKSLENHIKACHHWSMGAQLLSQIRRSANHSRKEKRAPLRKGQRLTIFMSHLQPYYQIS